MFLITAFTIPEFDNARQRLAKVMGECVVMLHGLPILYTGTKNVALIKSILDLEHWFKIVHKGRDVAKVREHCIRLTFGNNILHYSAGDSDGTPGAPSTSHSVGSPGAPTMFPTRMMLPTVEVR
jgi:hypothetical protein